MRSIRIILTATALLGLGGCATPELLPRDLPDLRTIHDRHLSGQQRGDRPIVVRTRPIEAGSAQLRGYTRSVYNEIDNLFPMLPNPTLVMYVDPHLSEAGYPVPGYATAFTLYDRPRFALPGEVPPPSDPPESTP